MKISTLAVVIFSFSVVAVFAGDSNRGLPAEGLLSSFRKNVLDARIILQKYLYDRNLSAKEASDELLKIPVDEHDPFYSSRCLLYIWIKARSHINPSGIMTEELELIEFMDRNAVAVFTNRPSIVNALLVYGNIYSALGEKYQERLFGHKFNEIYARLVPLNSRNGRFSGYGGDIGIVLVHPDPDRPYVDTSMPKIIPGKMLSIAMLLDELNLPRHAYTAYWEYLLGGEVVSVGLHESNSRIVANTKGMMRPEIAEIWLKMAKNAFDATEFELALGFWTNAALYADEEGLSKCLTLVNTWDASKDAAVTPTNPSNLKIQRNTRKNKFLEIINAYQELNIHPRAWALIDEFPEEFDTPDVLKSELQSDWVRILREPQNLQIPQYIYGSLIFPNGDPLSVRIPEPCSREAMIKVKELLRLPAGGALPKNEAAPKSTPESGVEK